MLRRLLARAEALGLSFGVKLTNTFPVKASHSELPDENIYMSGRALLPLSLRVAARIRLDFGSEMPISYCAGANAGNIALLYRAGLFPITVCTALLKPGGYERLYAMATALEEEKPARLTLDDAFLTELAKNLHAQAASIPSRHRAMRTSMPDDRPTVRTVVRLCASVCPNRANVIITVEGKKQMLHLDGLCNECGNCATFCGEKAAPYAEKLTLFADRAALEDSKNTGFAVLPGSGRFLLRHGGVCREVGPGDEGVPPEIAGVMIAVRDRYPWLLYG